jgi:hypothetical protein
MLIIFKSSASADMVIFEENAKQILSAISNDLSTALGIITVEQLPDAISKIRAAIASDKLFPQPLKSPEEEAEFGQDVSFSQRALPFLELLESSLEEKMPVIWGVNP